MATGWSTQYPFAFITGSTRYDIPFSISLDPEPLTADKREFYKVSYTPPLWGDTEYYNYTVNKISGNADLYHAVVYNVLSDSSSGSSFNVSVILCSSATFVASINNGVKFVGYDYRDTETRVTGEGMYTYDGKTVYYYIYNVTVGVGKDESVITTFNWHSSTKLNNNDWAVYYNTAKQYFAWLITYGDSSYTNNPYNRPSSEDEPARGGTGTWDNHSDVVDIEPLPAGAWGQGFVSAYNPTNAQLQNFATQLWREDLRSTWKDVFPNGGVTSGIVNCITIPVQPDVTASTRIHVGGIAIPETEAAVLLNRFKVVDFGIAPVRYTQEYFGGFQDYSCTKIGIYLPYIGWEQLAPEMVINCQLGLKYKIDCFTGDFIAILTTYREDKFSYRGISYTFTGNCATQVPITSQSGGSSASMISAAISSLTSIGSLMTGNVAGAITGGALAMNSIAAENDKHSFALKGGLTGSKGQLSYQRPYLCINRPVMEDGVKNNYFNLCGIPSNDYATIGSCAGFTKAFEVKLDNSAFNNASDEELNAIVNLLKEGIFCKLG